MRSAMPSAQVHRARPAAAGTRPAAVAGEVVEQLGEVGAELGVGREHAEVLVDGARSSGCSCRCRRGSSGGCRRPPGARRAGPWRGSSGRRARTPRARPPASSMRARSMLACSSKRALSSTSATTCLPASAAFTSDATMPASSPPVRYSVCLIASTCGSRAACSTNASTEVANESYGWCRSTSPLRSSRKTSAPSPPASSDRRLRHPRLVLELGPVERVQRPQPAQVERPVDHVDVVVGELELAAQQLEHLGRHLRVDLEPHDATELACAGAGRLHRREEVLGLVARARSRRRG